MNQLAIESCFIYTNSQFIMLIKRYFNDLAKSKEIGVSNKSEIGWNQNIKKWKKKKSNYILIYSALSSCAQSIVGVVIESR